MSKVTAIFAIIAGILIYLAGSVIDTLAGVTMIGGAICLLLFAILWEVIKRTSRK